MHSRNEFGVLDMQPVQNGARPHFVLSTLYCLDGCVTDELVERDTWNCYQDHLIWILRISLSEIMYLRSKYQQCGIFLATNASVGVAGWWM
jgi:hypothetical protein